ncbi:MAG TPA: geranylgeranyl reductase family protein [Moorella mulderi]|nr:geranylgeranyl reductase family protein [Moorella mulderi]
MEYDVIICGAGPAGSTCARFLAGQGAEVLLLDKAVFPRPKICGGGLTRGAVKELPPGWEGLKEGEIRHLVFLFKNEEPVEITFTQPVVYTVSRTLLDHWLLEQALEAGAKLREGFRVLGIEEDSKGTRVWGPKGESLRARYVVGADGAHSVVRRHLDLSIERGFCLNLEVPKPQVFSGEKIYFTYGYLLGYGWIFPRGAHLSVGMGAFFNCKVNFKPYLEKFCRKVGIDLPSIPWQGACLSFLPEGEVRLHTDRVLLIGEAAGLVDPFTGEGISHALRSARWAAGILMKALRGGGGLEEYGEKLGREMLRHIRYARFIARTVYTWAPWIHRLLGLRPQIVAKLLGVMAEENTYLDLWGYLTENYPLFRQAV